jgi:hypothetical protein
MSAKVFFSIQKPVAPAVLIAGQDTCAPSAECCQMLSQKFSGGLEAN